VAAAVLLALVLVVSLNGFLVIQPNQAKVAVWSCWSATAGPNRWSTAARSTPEPVDGESQGLPPARRQAPVRRPGALAADDLRSVNAQIEFLLRESLRRAGRLPAASAGEDGRGE
jgi:hypothetical protein